MGAINQTYDETPDEDDRFTDSDPEDISEDEPEISEEQPEDNWQNRMIERLGYVFESNEGISGLLYDLNNDNIPEAIIYIPQEFKGTNYTVCSIYGFSSDMKYFYESNTNIARETYAKIGVLSSTYVTESPYICLIGDSRTEYHKFDERFFVTDTYDSPLFRKEPRVIIVDNNTEVPVINDLTEWVYSWKGNPEPVTEQPETFEDVYDNFKLRTAGGECITSACPGEVNEYYEFFHKEFF